MHASVARRFANVKCVFIRQLLRQPTEEEEDTLDLDGDAQIVDDDTTMRTVPFISTFANIEKVCFGTWDFITGNDSPYEPVCRFFDHTRDKDRYSRLIDMFSYGYQRGTLPSSLEVKGLYCPDFHDDTPYLLTRMAIINNRRCEVCERACRSFPVRAMSRFTHEQASILDNIGVCIGRGRLVNIF